LKAYVLIQTAADSEPIAHALRGIRGVVSAEDLSGPFDAIALASSDSASRFMDGVLAEIHRLPGVIRALSAPLIGSHGKELEPAIASAGQHDAA
jgi:hypothetical protein